MKEQSMSDVARAFGVVARILKINGRRKQRAELEIKMRVVRIDPLNNARIAAMAPRAARRARVLELRAKAKRKDPTLTKKQLREQFIFRPVYGYVGPAFMPVSAAGGV